MQIPLSKGKIAIISDDFAYLAESKWYASKGRYTFYAQRTYTRADTKQRTSILMHRVIMESVVGRMLRQDEQVDHKDGNGLNNIPENLRLATTQEQSFNRKKRANSASSYKGVWRDRKKWRAVISINCGSKHLGMFDNEEGAARSYDTAAREHFGDRAKLNFPVDDLKEALRKILRARGQR